MADEDRLKKMIGNGEIMEPLARAMLETYLALIDAGMVREEAMGAIGSAVANFGVYIGGGMPESGEGEKT